MEKEVNTAPHHPTPQKARADHLRLIEFNEETYKNLKWTWIVLFRLQNA